MGTYSTRAEIGSRLTLLTASLHHSLFLPDLRPGLRRLRCFLGKCLLSAASRGITNQTFMRGAIRVRRKPLLDRTVIVSLGFAKCPARSDDGALRYREGIVCSLQDHRLTRDGEFFACCTEFGLKLGVGLRTSFEGGNAVGELLQIQDWLRFPIVSRDGILQCALK